MIIFTVLFQKLILISISLFGLGFLIFIHELGHFLFCKLFNIPAPIFSIGFGPTLVSRNYKGTDFKLSLIPLGGYVQIGNPEELNNTSSQDGSHEVDILKSKPLYKGVLVLLGGIIFNLLFAYTISIGLSIGNKLPKNLIHILSSDKNICINEKNTISEKIKTGFSMTNMLIEKTYNGIISLFRERKFNQLSGIVGILNGGMNAANSNFGSFLFFFIMISINLALGNLLPLPILDGGQILMLLLARIFKIKNMDFIHVIAFYISVSLLASIMLYSTWNDIIRIFMN